MRKLKIGAVMATLPHVLDKPFLFARAQVIWFGLIAIANFAAMSARTSGYEALSGIFEIISSVLLLPVVVSTHRYLLSGNVPVLHFGRTEGRYLLAAIGAYLPLILYILASVIVLATVAGPVPEGEEASMLHFMLAAGAIIIGLVVVFALVVPMSLVLPARAIGNNDFTYGEALSATRHNILRLAALVVALVVVGILAGIGITMLAALAASAGSITVLIVSIITTALDFVLTLFGAGILSLAFAGLVQGEEIFLES